jgi:hypothetical protein
MKLTKTELNQIIREEIALLNELKLTDLIGKSYTYVIGSSSSSKVGVGDKNYILSKIREMIFHYLFDIDFNLNYLNSIQQRKYKSAFDSEVLNPMLKNIDKTLSTFMETSSDKYRNYVKWKPTREQTQKMRDSFFVKNKKIPTDIKEAYYEYRLEYAGVRL